MKRTLALLLAVAVLLITAHRLPAPISEAPETTPTPKPKREMTPRSKPKPEATPKPAATPNRSFAGTWTGSTADSMSDGSKSNTLWSIKISDDEKTVLINWHVSGETTIGPGLQAPCIRFGSALSWSLKQLGDTPTWACTDTLQLNSNGTASFVRQGTFIAGDNQGVTYNNTGTLSREGASPAPSGPQTTTATTSQTMPTTAPKNADDLPVAKPVPAKPGFVYNPFDPNSRFLLDVRGKASGTKLIEQKSGKLFIVP
jgi:hypothetical protein